MSEAIQVTPTNESAQMRRRELRQAEGVDPDRVIVSMLDNTETTAGQVHMVAAEQEQLVQRRIERRRIDIKAHHDNIEREAHAKLQEIIAAAQQEYRSTLSAAEESRGAETQKMDAIETRTAYLFATCRQAADRIYAGKLRQKQTYDELSSHLAETEAELEHSEKEIDRIQSALKQNDEYAVSQQAMVEAYEDAISSAHQKKIRLHEEANSRASAGLKSREEAMIGKGEAQSAEDINREMGELEQMGYGYGGELILTQVQGRVLHEIIEIQRAIESYEETREGLLAEIVRIEQHNQALSDRWAALAARRTELFRYKDALMQLRKQLVEEAQELNEQANILMTITEGGVQRLVDVPEALQEVLVAAYDLITGGETSRSPQPQDIDFLNGPVIHIRDAAEVARRYPVQAEVVDSFSFNNGDSLEEAQQSIAATNVRFGLPAGLKEAFGKVATYLQAEPGVFRPGMQIEMTTE